uniref:Ion transport domain-containing protein n=1 Tax=Amphimedon queenslandica TaxID=400682 RepID=A0A1X7V958_AMPQE
FILCLPDLALFSLILLDYVLRSICRSVPSQSHCKCLPVTPDILRLLFQAWSRQPITFDAVLVWAACCVGFFGFLCSGEFTYPSQGAFTDSMLSSVMSFLFLTLLQLISHLSFVEVKLKFLGLEFEFISVQWMALFVQLSHCYLFWPLEVLSPAP